MKPFLAILGREIAERKLLFVGAAFASLFPILAPWLPGTSGQNPAELRGGMALGLAFITTTLLAVVLGATVIARDLSERRIGFYFARPVPGWALWAGKMLGAAVLSLGAGALILLSAFLAGGRIDAQGIVGPWSMPGKTGGLSSPAFFACAALAALLLLGASHALSLMVRSRSPWLAVDLVALALVATTFWMTNRLLAQEGAVKILGWGGLGWIAVLLCAVSLAGLVQVTRGRTDLRRGHRLLSLTLWTLMGAATFGYAAFAGWVLRVTPGDIVRIHAVAPAPSGSWLAVSGPTRGRGGYAPGFLLDLGSEGSGRFVKLPGFSSHYWWTPPLFSEDGRRAFWLERTGEESYQLLSLDLRHPESAPRRTSVISSTAYFGIEPSPDGRRVATLTKGRLIVEELDTGRLLASVPMEGTPFIFFLEDDRLRIFRSSYEEEPGMPEVSRWTTLDLDVASGRLRPVSRIELPGDEWTWRMSPRGGPVVLWNTKSREALLADLETGRTSPLPALYDPVTLRVLNDGRIVLRAQEEPQALRLLTPDGAEKLRVRLPESRVRIGSQVASDRLVLATAKHGSPGTRAWTSWILDLETGRLQTIGSGMVPAAGQAETGSPASRLFLRGEHGLALFDPATGRFRTLLDGKPVEPGP